MLENYLCRLNKKNRTILKNYQHTLSHQYHQTISQKSVWCQAEKRIQNYFHEISSGTFSKETHLTLNQSKLKNHTLNTSGLEEAFKALNIQPHKNLSFPEKNPISGETINWKVEIRKSTLKSMVRKSIRKSRTQIQTQDKSMDRLTQFMMLAIKAGHISLAMLIFSHLNSKDANQLNQKLIEKVQSLKEKKNKITEEITQQKNDEQGMKNIQKLKNQVEGVQDDMTVLQTFIKDVSQNKQQALELAHAFIRQEHQSIMSIVRSFNT